MPGVTGVGGVFIRARNADALRGWYAEHLGITLDGESGAQFTWTPEYGKFGWAVDPEGNRFELWQPPSGA